MLKNSLCACNIKLLHSYNSIDNFFMQGLYSLVIMVYNNYSNHGYKKIERPRKTWAKVRTMEKGRQFKACYTPEEVKHVVFGDTVSLTVIRQAIHKGEIPSMRLGEGNRTKILIPGSYVREMASKGYCEGHV